MTLKLSEQARRDVRNHAEKRFAVPYTQLARVYFTYDDNPQECNMIVYAPCKFDPDHSDPNIAFIAVEKALVDSTRKIEILSVEEL